LSFLHDKNWTPRQEQPLRETLRSGKPPQVLPQPTRARLFAEDGSVLHAVPRLTDARLESAMDGGMNDPGFRDALSNALDQSRQGIAALRQ